MRLMNATDVRCDDCRADAGEHCRPDCLGYAAMQDAGLGVGHIWTEVQCPAYRSFDPADCTCTGASGANPVSARLVERFRVNQANVYAWGFVPDEQCTVRVVELRESADPFFRGWFAFVDWNVRPDGNVRPSGWVRTSKLVTCPACEGSGEVPSASGWTDVRCEVCAEGRPTYGRAPERVLRMPTTTLARRWQQ